MRRRKKKRRRRRKKKSGTKSRTTPRADPKRKQHVQAPIQMFQVMQSTHNDTGAGGANNPGGETCNEAIFERWYGMRGK